jgi:diadenosine tetraphosphate (Ap4A) HIT family hydrolase
MDIIITDHSPENLEDKFENHFLYQNSDYAIMCESTEIPWLQFIPNRPVTPDYAGQLYAEMVALAEYLRSEGFGEHYNIAKIGNKLPYYHIHLVMRNRNDQAWPETIWGLDLTEDVSVIERFKTSLERYFSQA